MTYLTFHFLFLIPPIVGLALTLPRPRPPGTIWLLTVIPVLAVIYTTPWDSALIRRGVWTYDSRDVLGVLWGIPWEEYLFFMLQPILLGLWGLRVAAGMPWGRQERGPLRPRLLAAAVLLAIAAAAAGSLRWEPTTYLGLILAWALPVIAVQWSWGGGVFAATRRRLILAIAVPTVYLWVIDRFAIGLGLWTISPRLSTGWAPLGLPAEEAVFFLVTTVMCVQGQWAILWVAGRLRADRPVTRPRRRDPLRAPVTR